MRGSATFYGATRAGDIYLQIFGLLPLSIYLLDTAQYLPKGHISLDLYRIVGHGINGFPAGTSMQAEILLYYQGGMSIVLVQVDALAAELFRAAIEAVSRTDFLDRLQCIHHGIHVFGADANLARQRDSLTWHFPPPSSSIPSNFPIGRSGTVYELSLIHI